jgi:hypothetical protein
MRWQWRVVRAGIYILLGVGFAYLFYVRYWKWRECIAQAMSSCITPDGTNLIGGGSFWAVPAIAFMVAGMRLLLKR